jgi:branched-chain amino acid transport system substrate-binding protein
MVTRRAGSFAAVVALAAFAAPATTEPPQGTEPAGTAPAGTVPAGSEPAAEAPSGEPITIGTLTTLTGPFTAWGVQIRDGMQMGVDEINAAGGIDGRPLELVVIDDQNVAEEGVSGMERLIEGGAVAIGGIVSSDIGLATATVAEEAQVPLFTVKAGAQDILTADSRYTFRSCLPAAPMVADPVVQYIQEQGITRVGAIIADYAWGQTFGAALEEAVGEVDGVELQVEVAPVPEQDFTTYLRALEELDPELIVATGHPPGVGPITVQSADLGINVPVTGAWGILSAAMEGVGDTAFGRLADFDCADFFSEDYQELARRYLEFSDNEFMEDDAVAGYGIVQMVAQALGEVGDDPVAIAEYLHANSFELPGYAYDELSWTEWGEIASATPVFTVMGEGPAPDGVNEAGEWYPKELSRSEPLEPFMPQ